MPPLTLYKANMLLSSFNIILFLILKIKCFFLINLLGCNFHCEIVFKRSFIVNDKVVILLLGLGQRVCAIVYAYQTNLT